MFIYLQCQQRHEAIGCRPNLENTTAGPIFPCKYPNLGNCPRDTVSLKTVLGKFTVIFDRSCQFNMMNKIAVTKMILWNFVPNIDILFGFCLIIHVFSDVFSIFDDSVRHWVSSGGQSCPFCFHVMQSVFAAVIVDKAALAPRDCRCR